MCRLLTASLLTYALILTFPTGSFSTPDEARTRFGPEIVIEGARANFGPEIVIEGARAVPEG